MTRWFHIAGPCDPREHYMIPPERRLTEARALIEQGRFFSLVAGRQTGKTTSVLWLLDHLNAGGERSALERYPGSSTLRFHQAQLQMARGEYPTARQTLGAAVERRWSTRYEAAPFQVRDERHEVRSLDAERVADVGHGDALRARLVPIDVEKEIPSLCG